jgi:hypothetical protein
MTSSPPFQDEELLHRQVHPSLLVAGRPSSGAFSPTTKDEGKLSVDRDSKASARESFEAFVGAGFNSAGVWSVTAGECGATGLPIEYDPVTEPYPNAAHSFVDFRGLSRSQQRSRAQLLARAADERGCQYVDTSTR